MYALVLLLVFIFSIVPRIHLHELVADHSDISYHQPTKEKIFSEAGINCHFDKLAAESPFVNHFFARAATLLPHPEGKPCPPAHDHHFSFVLDKDNKGPPA